MAISTCFGRCPICEGENHDVTEDTKVGAIYPLGHLGVVNLYSLEDFTCQECDAEFTLADVRAFIEKWCKVLTWIEAAPAVS